jgi:hypothetical protein
MVRVEADDVLGTLGKQADEQGIETIIVTGDNDMLQAVLPRVKAMAPRRSFTDTILYDEQAVEQKYGIKPEQLAALKALAGDVSGWGLACSGGPQTRRPAPLAERAHDSLGLSGGGGDGPAAV